MRRQRPHIKYQPRPEEEVHRMPGVLALAADIMTVVVGNPPLYYPIDSD